MRKRGKRFSRHIDELAAFRAAGRQHPLDASQKRRLGVSLRLHLETLAIGKAEDIAFHHLANAVNHSMVLTERGTGAEYEELVAGAQQALLRLSANGRLRGRWLLDGPNLTALKDWLDLYEAQLAAIPQQEAIDALDEVERRRVSGQVFEEATA